MGVWVWSSEETNVGPPAPWWMALSPEKAWRGDKGLGRSPEDPLGFRVGKGRRSLNRRWDKNERSGMARRRGVVGIM